MSPRPPRTLPSHRSRAVRADYRSNPARPAPRPLGPCLFAAVVLLVTPVLLGAGPRPVEIAYFARSEELHVSFDLVGHLPSSFRERVDSGLTAALAIHVSVLPISATGEIVGSPANLVVLRCEIQYDLWSERFHLSLIKEGSKRQLITSSKDEALRACASPNSLSLVSLDHIDLRRRYVVDIRLDTEPDMAEVRARAMDYLIDPGRQGAHSSGRRSLLGTIARALFQERTEETDLIHFRGVPFGEPLISQALSAAEQLEGARANEPDYAETEEE